MTNYEKHKDEIIDLLTRANNCIRLLRICGHEGECGKYACLDCQDKLKQWLNEEAKEFDPAELKAGDKIRMRKHGNTEFSEFEVVCNHFPACWLRFRESENDIPQADDDFLIFYDDLLDKYEIREVFR